MMFRDEQHRRAEFERLGRRCNTGERNQRVVHFLESLGNLSVALTLRLELNRYMRMFADQSDSTPLASNQRPSRSGAMVCSVSAVAMPNSGRSLVITLSCSVRIVLAASMTGTVPGAVGSFSVNQEAQMRQDYRCRT